MSYLNCPCCDSKYVKRNFISYNRINYTVCGNCGSSYQNIKVKINYTNTNWENFKDPDGNTRNLKKEKNFKIKNWYGDTINYLNKNYNGKILDIGAGLGFFLSALNSFKWEKYALETSMDCINYIKENFKDIKTFNETIDNHRFNKETFDVIFFYHVFEHLDKPLFAIDEIYKLLKKKGLLIIGTPNNSSICSAIFNKNFRLLGPEHNFIISFKQLRKILIERNFNIKKIEYPYFKTDYFNLKNFFKMFNLKGVSPPFYGSIMTFYAEKK
jgi:2-polyprenyl-3-methyl-5-hydroxy-6-metoxy-1,4-benzoquinol methylase